MFSNGKKLASETSESIVTLPVRMKSSAMRQSSGRAPAGMERAAPESVAHFIVTTIVRVTPLGNQIRYKGRPSRYS